MFRKLLIANRGEIAVRIARTCREMGISPVAVYSEVDRPALHVRVCDEAYPIGPAPSTESYLRADRIVEAAHKAGAEAIHPGYGFLSESAAFAATVRDAGLTLVGPSPESMLIMGSKTRARKAVRDAGAPLVPGTVEAIEDAAELARVAQEIGYPIMLKAASGGGGKGMRLVHSAAEVDAAFARAGAEAAAAFGDGAVYVEKAILTPRHVEIQILADRHGSCVYLGERECSIQRRHQKVVEECPATFDDAGLRRRMGEAAVRIALAAGYEGAGTVEFLVDADRNFYFLEMNTRLQVEHPVTELVVGIDLVAAQIRIALGEPLWLTQDDVTMRGVAIECRVYAEDPENDFTPSPGRITSIVRPSGPGVRLDEGVYAGWEVPIHYDPLLAKLAVWAPTRREAIARLRRALGEYVIGGIRTTLPLFMAIAERADFADGAIDTGYLDRMLASGAPLSPMHDDSLETDLAIVAAALHTRAGSQRTAAPRRAESAWKRAGRAAGR